MKKNILLIISVYMISSINIFAQNTFTHKVGNYEIILLSESQSNASKDILIGATQEMLNQYAPDGKFPNAVNAYLIKTPTSNILVDAGFGTKLFDNLNIAGVSPEEINIILLTHMHGDHITGLLKDGNITFPNAKIYIAQKEYDYWMNDELMKNLPANKQNSFNKPREVIKAYKNKIHIFNPNELDAGFSELVPGIRGIVAYGHTPGHVMYFIESENEKFIIWGDLTHAMAIQMPYPHISVTYDVDPKMAEESRQKVLKYIAKHNIPIAGMHIAFPGMGIIEDNNAGGYKFIPFK